MENQKRTKKEIHPLNDIVTLRVLQLSLEQHTNHRTTRMHTGEGEKANICLDDVFPNWAPLVRQSA